MNESNKRKNELLGEPYGTANAKLRKALLFKLLIKLKENICYQCGKEIQTLEELSIEHKEPWMRSSNPIKSFYDLENIAFSHLKCNKRIPAKGIPNHAVEGELSSNAKLTEKEVLEIRDKLKRNYSLSTLSKEYKISKRAIMYIRNRDTWKHI